MNKLISRQITKHWGHTDNVPDDVKKFLEVIAETYEHNDRDRSMLERAIELTSSEMIALNERLRAESQELRKAHEELKTLFRNIETAFFTVDMTLNKVTQISPSCEKIFGYTADEFLNNSDLWFDAVLEEDKHIVENDYPMLNAGERLSPIHRIKTKDGTIRWVETKITPTLGADGKVVRIDGITTDITSKKEAEEQNHLLEIRFRKLIEHSHEGISLLGTDGRVQYVSPSVERILGYTVEELNAADPTDYIHPDDQKEVMSMIAEIMNQYGASKRISYRVKNKAGVWRWVRANISNLIHEKSVNALVFNYEDITEHKEALNQIEFDRRNRDALINSTNDLMWSFDSDLRLITANNSFLTVMKHTIGADLVCGDNLLHPSIPLQTLIKWKSLYSRVLSGESFVYENHENVTEDLWAELSLKPIVENGKVIGGSCVWHDITEKKINSEKLLASERMMAVAQRLSSLGSWEIKFNVQGKLIRESLSWSNEVYRIYGYNPDTHTPSFADNAKHILPADATLLSEWSLALLHGDSPGSVDFRIYTTDGELRWVKTSADLIFDPVTNKRSKIVGTVQDITERKLLERDRVQVNRDLVQRNKALEQFAHIVSHNLRAPVANILGLSNLIQLSEKDRNTQQQCINGLTISAQRLDDIIQDLNKILQVKRGMTDESNLVNLDLLVSNIKDSIGMQIDEEKVTIHTDFSEIEDLYTNRSYMHSIFLNLISNSIKYRRPNVKPIIEISSRKEEGKMFLSFKDNSMGIDLDKHGSNVFGLYKRFHHTAEGKGLGMFMVKTQVETLGGKIAIKSEVDKGTEIIIELSVA